MRSGTATRVNLPNGLTISRIFLVPLLVVVLLTKFEGHLILGVRKELVGAAIFAIASLTDWLDGYFARRRQQVTALGQMMDPMADKLLTSAAFISLVQMGLAPAWMVAIIIGRELAVTGLRSIAYTRGVAMPASPLGKFKMAAQVVAILLLILGQADLRGFAVAGQVALWVVRGDGRGVGRRLLLEVQPAAGQGGPVRSRRPAGRSEAGRARLSVHGRDDVAGLNRVAGLGDPHGGHIGVDRDHDHLPDFDHRQVLLILDERG